MSSKVCARCRPSAVSRSLRSLLMPRAHRRSNSTKAEPAPNSQNVTIFSGIQPTGVPHLGNYFGAMRQWKKLQDGALDGTKLMFSIVDLHAITMPQDGPILRQRSAEMLAALLAIGLDPQKSTLFYQSSVPAHTELMWILSCTASFGYLGRMTQWKSKLSLDNNALPFTEEVTSSKLKLGLFSYPVLQAADILIHGATHVPVGDDQRQHLEFARECATNFNHAYPGVDLIAPQTITTPSPRVMSLTNPLKKMSKSTPNHRSRILITADEAQIRSRINSTVTDSMNLVTYDPAHRPGVANLLELLAQCDPHDRSPGQLAKDMGNEANLKQLKGIVGDALVGELAGIKERYEEILGRQGGKWIREVQEEGAVRARSSAEGTMRRVREAVGLGAP
ncbi:tryptophanyl-tRNA synthetase [Pseudomassariella vexata]|uniref:tryptophan--tRNA ligase n=1 Tax=Pseudomassariella vexata TaxID=1141098 RepID=A0A1Y2EFU4_9PEZI|nr:tryptophanyl-tRNA synthetase [Pseudomassariella vexata]ORY69665.1 tryptophanyl-tRNA synthetase [Pseudomassariella vexata]